MSVVYRLVGYDHMTGRLADSIEIPAEGIGFAKSVAGIPCDQDGVGDYELSEAQARDIAGATGISLKTPIPDYFLESDRSDDQEDERAT